MADVSLRTYIKQVDEMIDNGRVDEAVAHIRHILEHYPKQVDTYRLMAKALLDRNRFLDSADIFQRVLSVIPDDFISHVGMAIVHEDGSSLLEAIWHMERAFEINPNNDAIKGELMRLYEEQHGVAPEVHLTQAALARMYYRGFLYSQAVAEAQAALAASSEKNIALHTLLAASLWQAGQDDAAEQAAETILKDLPYCLTANRIKAFIEQNRTDNKNTIFHQRLLAVDPHFEFVGDGDRALTADGVADESVMLPMLDDVPVTSGESQPDWMRAAGVAEPAQQDEDDGNGAPEWLREASSAAATGTRRPTGTGRLNALTGTGELGRSGNTPDWLTQPEQTEESDMPSWLTGLEGETDAPEAVLGEAEAEVDEDAFPWLAKADDGDDGDGDLPDWMQAEAGDSTASADDEGDESTDWLAAAAAAGAGATAVGAASAATASADAFDWMDGGDNADATADDDAAPADWVQPTVGEDAEVDEDANVPDWMQVDAQLGGESESELDLSDIFSGDAEDAGESGDLDALYASGDDDDAPGEADQATDFASFLADDAEDADADDDADFASYIADEAEGDDELLPDWLAADAGGDPQDTLASFLAADSDGDDDEMNTGQFLSMLASETDSADAAPPDFSAATETDPDMDAAAAGLMDWLETKVGDDDDDDGGFAAFLAEEAAAGDAEATGSDGGTTTDHDTTTNGDTTADGETQAGSDDAVAEVVTSNSDGDDDTAGDDLPDWIVDAANADDDQKTLAGFLADLPGGDDDDETPPTYDISGATETDPTMDAAAADLMDWLEGQVGDDEGETAAATETVDEGDENLPDFIKDAGWGPRDPSIGLDDLPPLPPLDEDEDDGVAELVPGEVPDWVQAMKPEDEAAEHDDETAVIDADVGDVPDLASFTTDDDSEAIAAMGVSEAALDLPDWMVDDTETAGDETTVGDETSESAVDLPDWLDADDDAPVATSADDIDLPDWLLAGGDDAAPDDAPQDDAGDITGRVTDPDMDEAMADLTAWLDEEADSDDDGPAAAGNIAATPAADTDALDDPDLDEAMADLGAWLEANSDELAAVQAVEPAPSPLGDPDLDEAMADLGMWLQENDEEVAAVTAAVSASDDGDEDSAAAEDGTSDGDAAVMAWLEAELEPTSDEDDAAVLAAMTDDVDAGDDDDATATADVAEPDDAGAELDDALSWLMEEMDSNAEDAATADAVGDDEDLSWLSAVEADDSDNLPSLEDATETDPAMDAAVAGLMDWLEDEVADAEDDAAAVASDDGSDDADDASETGEAGDSEEDDEAWDGEAFAWLDSLAGQDGNSDDGQPATLPFVDEDAGSEDAGMAAAWLETLDDNDQNADDSGNEESSDTPQDDIDLSTDDGEEGSDTPQQDEVEAPAAAPAGDGIDVAFSWLDSLAGDIEPDTEKPWRAPPAPRFGGTVELPTDWIDGEDNDAPPTPKTLAAAAASRMQDDDDEDEEVPAMSDGAARQRLADARGAMSERSYDVAAENYNALVRSEKMLSDVIHDLESWAAERPDSAALLRTLGDAYMHNDQLQQALATYQRALGTVNQAADSVGVVTVW